MFHRFSGMCIERADKREKIASLFSNVGGMKIIIEKDMTAFEFGTSEKL